jgi:hypothetical protein
VRGDIEDIEEDESFEEDMMSVEHSDEMRMGNVNDDVAEEWLMGMT